MSSKSVSVYYHFGYVLPEYSNFVYIVDKPVYAATANLAWQTRGKNDWEQIYNFPSYGISFFYSTLGNDRIHGREFAVTPYFHVDIISRRRFNFFNETAFGLGYVTRKFDEETNYLNIAVGSHLNLHFNLKFGAAYDVTDRLKVNGGLSFDHFSNANSRNPNLGINWVTSFLGMTYGIGDRIALERKDLTPHRRDLSYELIYSFGGKRSRGVLNKELYYTSSITFEAKYNLLRTIRLGAGLDVFYDPSAQKEMEALNKYDFEKRDNFRTGIHLSQEFVYSRLSLILQQGIYIGLTDSVNGKSMYNRGIVRFAISNQMFMQLAMKSHLHILDYPELGIGIKW